MGSGYVNPIHTVLFVIGNSFVFWHYYGYETQPSGVRDETK